MLCHIYLKEGGGLTKTIVSDLETVRFYLGRQGLNAIFDNVRKSARKVFGNGPLGKGENKNNLKRSGIFQMGGGGLCIPFQIFF